MIIWGSGGDAIALGAADSAHCNQCAQQRSFRHVLQYRYAHLWYVFSWVTKKQYLRVCDGCNQVTPLDTKTFEESRGKPPIPAYRRFGGLVLLGLIAAVVAFGVYSDSQTSKRDDALLAQPAQGDRYTVDLQTVAPGAYEGHAYGVVRVDSVNGQTITLALPSKGYDKWKGAERDAGGSSTRQPAYYTDDHVEVPLSKLQSLHASNELRHVYR
ncbi:hypothetical protein ACI6Q5_06200 [Xanthomonas codiaei]|uniref:Zinc-ribbon 15 domain-containing protein n=1 Tax=Xanthomonas codiaei TaxID=56463 RepID=A0A2S7CME2_9XANT|nr:hypothetical protein [Xanthomonas codiaei]PPU62710.1 hypothetical protein XcodCFBP4690_13355 [Xanthomonas codiaei]